MQSSEALDTKEEEDTNKKIPRSHTVLARMAAFNKNEKKTFRADKTPHEATKFLWHLHESDESADFLCEEWST